MQKIFTILFLSTIVVANSAAHGQSTSNRKAIELVGVVSISADTQDLSKLEGGFENGIRQNQFGGISGIDYDTKHDCYWAISDRGPNDGAVDWICRAHKLELKLGPDRQAATAKLLKTVILQDPQGRTFSGSSAAFQYVSAIAGRFDPEGIRVFRNTLFISDEYGPYLKQFSLDGTQQAELRVPDSYKIETHHRDEAEEKAANQSGRLPNRGMEGLACSTDGRLFGLMQSPLIQDSQRLDNGSVVGLNCRLVAYDSTPAPSAEFVYRLDDQKNKLNEILSIDDNRFLVIERDSEVGAASAFKRIMLADLGQATDVSNLSSLPLELNESLRPVQKSTFIDLLDPAFGLVGESFPEKVEGLSWGPTMPDGRKTLVVAVDNDFEPTIPTQIWIFAIEPKVLQ
jgi:hypothetical protein